MTPQTDTVASLIFRAAFLIALGGTFVVTGCRANLGEGRDGTGSDPTENGGVLYPEGAGPAPLRLLTREEYRYSLEDVFGAIPEITAELEQFPPEITGSSGFATVGSMSAINVRQYMLAAETLAPTLGSRLVSSHTCLSQSDPGEACVGEVIKDVGKRLLRHPPTSDEFADYIGLFSAERAHSDFKVSFELVLAGLLQSPAFLYRWELDSSPLQWDETATLVRLTSYQLASRLSYFLWKSVPDAALMSAAESGKLSTVDGLRAEAERMLADPKATRTAASFHTQWLHVEKLPRLVKNEARFPEFTEAMKAAMLRDFENFAETQLLGGGTFDTLFGGEVETADPVSSSLFSSDAPGARGGILTTPAFLATEADLNEGNPILRGKVVREQILCETLTAPPPGIPTLGTLDASLPMRERLKMHVEEPSCRGCHQKTDPIGFGFGNFDAIGRYQAVELGVPVDASGMVYGLDGRDVSYVGAAELGKVLGQSPSVRACVTNQWFRYALGRKEVASELGELTTALEDAEAQGGVLKSVVLALVSSRPFSFRAPIAGEKP